MSNEEPVMEWKTIRISATSYYKLAELSGFYTALLGAKVSMSLVANWAVTVYYDENYPKIKKILMNPDVAKRFRKKVGGEIKQLLELFREPEYDV